MAKGIIRLPVEQGLQQLNWYIGRAEVDGSNDTNPVVQVRVNNDADFVAKRLWLFQWPSATAAGTLPADTSVIFRDGGTNRGLALAAGFNRSIAHDLSVARTTAAYLGLPSPFLIRRKNNLFVELTRPSAAGTTWKGDVFCVLEGFKIYPGHAEMVAKTISQYAIPYSLNSNVEIVQPTAAAANAQNQRTTITNNGEGQFLAKNFLFQAIDDVNADVTDAIRPLLGLQFTDTTSGNKEWVNQQAASSKATLCPSGIIDMAGTGLPFNTPRYIDSNGSIRVDLLFDDSVASFAALAAVGTWPITFTFNFGGALLVR